MKGWPGEPQMAYDELMAQDAAAAADGAPITQVIFDFGNVLLYWDPEAVMIPRYSQRLVDGFLDNDVSSFYDANDLMDAGASLEEGVAYVREHRGEPWASMMRYYVFADWCRNRRSRADRGSSCRRNRSMGAVELAAGPVSDC